MDFLPLGLGASGEEVKLLQKALNEKVGLSLKPDGDYGVATQNALIQFQNTNDLEPTGIYAEDEYNILGPFIDEKYIRYLDIETVANENAFDKAFVKAVADVEGKSTGFLADGRPLILFERHKFYQEITKMFGRARADQIQSINSNICHPVWDRTAYVGYAGEFKRLDIARSFSEECAYKAASWGMFQIMGQNHQLCDVDNVFDFVAANEVNEHYHLHFFISFIINQPKLLKAFQNRAIETFVTLYNGPGQVEFYSGRIRAAMRRYA